MRRPLLLTGFMATGKSSVGPRVAEIAGRHFFDLDTLIEQRTGQRVADIFERSGEAEFRALERRELVALLGEARRDAPVVALGGGTLMPRDLRLYALDRAVVVTLEASPGEISRRASSNASRPLLRGSNPEQRAAELLELRAPAYAEAHARIVTDQRSVDAVAEDALAIWRRDAIAVAAGVSSYAVEIGRNLISSRLSPLIGKPSSTFVVSDEIVFPLHGARVMGALSSLHPQVIELASGEEHKHIGSVERIWRAALEAGADRGSRFVALGGGVVTDITGFAAATYMRGVSWVGVPTTLLAMVDASVGGKTGVDLESAKNAVGAFNQPKAVLCDVDVLATESARGFRGALAEVVKTALVGDAALLEMLESDTERVAQRDPELVTELVRRSIRVKARIVSHDERESGLRAVLNLGHTVGHALEAQAGYSRLSHGEAVSLGLVAALRIGVKLGVTPKELPPRVQSLLTALGLPTDLSAEPLEKATALLGHDKKRAGKKLRFVAARAPEQVETIDLELDQVRELALGCAAS